MGEKAHHFFTPLQQGPTASPRSTFNLPLLWGKVSLLLGSRVLTEQAYSEQCQHYRVQSGQVPLLFTLFDVQLSRTPVSKPLPAGLGMIYWRLSILHSSLSSSQLIFLETRTGELLPLPITPVGTAP